MNEFLELRNRYQKKKENNECNNKQIEFLDTFMDDDFCFLRINSS